MSDFSNFLEVQTKTAWGRTLAEFASFCNSSVFSERRPAKSPQGEPAEGRRFQHAFVILDVGCGPGLLPAMFARQGHTAFGIDADFSLLAPFFIPNVAQADALKLPFQPATFDLVTATNLLFLLDDPLRALLEWKRVLVPGGVLCLLNPSENLSTTAAMNLADQRGLQGIARESLLNWACNAETHFHWTEAETRQLLSRAGFRLEESVLRVGPGFARFTRARFD